MRAPPTAPPVPTPLASSKRRPWFAVRSRVAGLPPPSALRRRFPTPCRPLFRRARERDSPRSDSPLRQLLVGRRAFVRCRSDLFSSLPSPSLMAVTIRSMDGRSGRSNGGTWKNCQRCTVVDMARTVGHRYRVISTETQLVGRLVLAATPTYVPGKERRKRWSWLRTGRVGIAIPISSGSGSERLLRTTTLMRKPIARHVQWVGGAAYVSRGVKDRVLT